MDPIRINEIPEVSTPDEYDALLDRCCLGPNVKDIEGIDRDARFESLTPEDVKKLDNWFGENGCFVQLTISDLDMALHILGAREVDPTREPFNYVRGKRDERVYYFLSRNVHNRMLKPSNLGDLLKEGLRYDLANGYFVRGPLAQVDAWGTVSNLQHRLFAAIDVHDVTGEFPKFTVLTEVGYPPQLNAVNDRGQPKTGQDQEFIDRTQFTYDDLRKWVEYMPENVDKVRNELTKILVTSRNNIWSRLHKTGYHPSKKNQPSTREALALQQKFGNGGKDLEKLITITWEASLSEDGKKTLWAKHISPAMAVTAIVLASNADNDDDENLLIDFDLADKILHALRSSSEEGTEGYSKFIREIAAVKKQAKKPTGLDRWVFWGFTKSTMDILEKGELDPETQYFPSVTKKLIEDMRKGRISYPIFGGLDQGPVEVEE
ncbi:MAG: hypothetical protein KatS3mg087_1355 [Patescibacteria group bacterium]|nr:MAG: hypothetical protein KatS3mg087_1355 [Patescibacteria group bacterium]